MDRCIWEINDDVVLVDGAKNAAIHNLITGDVFSINEEAKKIICKYIKMEKIDDAESKYLNLLFQNKLLNTDSTAVKEYVPEKISKELKTVWLEITQACNMRCVHCYEGQSHISCKNSLSLDEWKSVIDQIIEIDAKSIIVIGGEPCIHKNVIDILKYIRKKSQLVKVTLFTNGYFLKDELLNVVIENNIDVKMSLYGSDAEIHDSITGIKGSFDKIVDLIYLLHDKNINVNIAITMMKENENDYENIKSLVQKWPIKGYKFDVIREVVDGQQSVHLPERREIRELVQRRKPNFYVKKRRFDKNYYFNSCWGSKLVITENGEVFPCVFCRNHSYGNILSNDIEDIINSSSLLEKFWCKTLDDVTECRDCEYRYACNDCRAYAESVCGLDGKNPRCYYDPYKGVWM